MLMLLNDFIQCVCVGGLSVMNVITHWSSAVCVLD